MLQRNALDQKKLNPVTGVRIVPQQAINEPSQPYDRLTSARKVAIFSALNWCPGAKRDSRWGNTYTTQPVQLLSNFMISK